MTNLLTEKEVGLVTALIDAGMKAVSTMEIQQQVGLSTLDSALTKLNAQWQELKQSETEAEQAKAEEEKQARAKEAHAKLVEQIRAEVKNEVTSNA